MSLNKDEIPDGIRILGMQPEPSMVRDDLEMYDMVYRTRDPEVFKKGQALVKDYVDSLDFELSGNDLVIIDDPMQISMGDCSGDTGRFNLNIIARLLEKLGFFGKSAAYREVSKNAD